LGWDDWFQERFALFASEGYAPARVIADFGAEYLLHDGEESLRAAAGRHLRNDGGQLPAVGDWVAFRHGEPVGTIHGWVERKTAFSRKVASVETKESGGLPVVVLTKSDIAASPDELRSELEAAAIGTAVVVTSAITGEGVEVLAKQLRPARTGVLLGPSGAGKSTLINRMGGAEVMKTRTVHRSGEGRQMTSHRELIQLPGGGMIIDTPGLREAQLWTGEEGLESLFEDVDRVARDCRFNDCEHRSEPGCAIKAAIERGELDAARLESYRKLQRELRAVAARSDARVRAEDRRKWKQISVDNKVRSRLVGK